MEGKIFFLSIKEGLPYYHISALPPSLYNHSDKNRVLSIEIQLSHSHNSYSFAARIFHILAPYLAIEVH